MIISGSITKTRADGSQDHADYLVDTEAKTLTQVGGDVEIVGEDIDLICGLMNTDHEGDEP